MSRFTICSLAGAREKLIWSRERSALAPAPLAVTTTLYPLSSTLYPTLIYSCGWPTLRSRTPAAPCEGWVPCHRPRTPTQRRTRTDRHVAAPRRPEFDARCENGRRRILRDATHRCT